MPFFVGPTLNNPPDSFQSDTHKRIYQTLSDLQIDFCRVDTDDGTTMESCAFISEGLGAQVVKTILLCNRQQTQLYLYVTSGDKPFVTRDFCSALSISRVSFAPSEMLFERLGTLVGATTVLSLINDTDCRISLVIDQDIIDREWFACADGTTTCFMKMKTSDLLNRFLPYTHHTPQII